MRRLIRYAAYPLILGPAAGTLLCFATAGVAYWPAFPLVTLAAALAVALLERLQPFEPAWLLDHGDTLDDALHTLVGVALTQLSVALLFAGRLYLPQLPRIWPVSAPVWAQVLLAGVVIDLGLYLMHRLSHASGPLWRLHALHHSAERLYWLNGGRRHPLSALVLAGPSLTLLFVLGATPIAVGAWLGIMSVHLSLQHANLDYRLGPLRKWLGVAEMHRWHHKREYEDAQVNFGEVLLVWDRMFGTFHDRAGMPRAGEVGLREDAVPRGYWKQLLWPFEHQGSHRGT